MAKLQLSVAVGDYDRVRPLVDGAVGIDGVDPTYMTLVPEEIFFRAFRHAEFDICELSLSSFALKTAQGGNPYVGVPVFLSRAFRHTSIYVRTDRVQKPADLKGRKIGVPEYQLTANVWARAILADDHEVAPADVTWVRGGIETPGRPEKISIDLPKEIRLENAPDGATISELLVGVRRTIAERHPWLPAAVLKAFEQAKAAALAKLSDTSATKVTLPFVEEQLKAARTLMGHDFWSYGVAQNRHVLEAFLRHHHAQGLSPRPLAVEELFHSTTLEAHKV